ncbi:hypothetical protein LSAT2_006691 [Lamellibrachia satsuma]|nr:hypothetical protein LSAT2_006691 [Lamellibrachia satsuma]
MGGCCGKGTAPNDADKTPYSQAKKPTSKAEPAPGKEPVSPPTVTKPADEATTEGPPTDQVQAAKQDKHIGQRLGAIEGSGVGYVHIAPLPFPCPRTPGKQGYWPDGHRRINQSSA